MQSRLHIDILTNLKTLGISEPCIQRIMNAVEKMPGKDHLKGALKFLTELTDKKSQRENYYQYSNHFAEYFCTISNLGLFAVAFYYKDYATFAAATFSALSHAIPSQRLHDLDMLGVFVIFGKAIANYKMIMQKPDVLAWGLGAFSINVLDTIITRSYLDKIGPSIHVVWHLAAAFALYKFNQAQIEFSKNELQTMQQAIQKQEVPNFLQYAHEKIVEYVNPVKDISCVML